MTASSSSKSIADAVKARNARKHAAAKRGQDAPPAPIPDAVDSGPVPTSSAPAVSPVAPRATRQRSTVDFPSEFHRELVAWQQHTAARLAVSRVTRQDLVTAALRVVLDRPEVAELVIAEIQKANRP